MLKIFISIWKDNSIWHPSVSRGDNVVVSLGRDYEDLGILIRGDLLLGVAC